MGFSKMMNVNGRLVYACDFSFFECLSVNCKPLYCPFKYCQRYYACKNCYPKALKKHFTEEAHDACRKNLALYNIERKRRIRGIS